MNEELDAKLLMLFVLVAILSGICLLNSYQLWALQHRATRTVIFLPITPKNP
jgi:hypothetical protein